MVVLLRYASSDPRLPLPQRLYSGMTLAEYFVKSAMRVLPTGALTENPARFYRLPVYPFFAKHSSPLARS